MKRLAPSRSDQSMLAIAWLRKSHHESFRNDRICYNRVLALGLAFARHTIQPNSTLMLISSILGKRPL